MTEKDLIIQDLRREKKMNILIDGRILTTAEEAIKNINALNAVCGQKGLYDAEFESALALAIDALEKQIPKKPYWEYGGWHCKSCGLDVLSDEYFCPLCGQAIDWEETDNAHT